MKHNLQNIPQVALENVEGFYVTGTKNRDAVGSKDNLKVNLKDVASGSALGVADIVCRYSCENCRQH